MSNYILEEYQKFLDEIHNIPLISKQREIELAKRIEQGDKEARNELVEAHFPLVFKIAKYYVETSMDLAIMDLFQEGYLGLLEAVDKFEWEKGNRFSTYARWKIRFSIKKAISEQGRTIQISKYKLEIISKYNQAVKQLSQNLGRTPSSEEIATEMNISVEKVHQIIREARNTVSLDMLVGEDEKDTTLGELISDERNLSPDDQVYLNSLPAHVQKVLQDIPVEEFRDFWEGKGEPFSRRNKILSIITTEKKSTTLQSDLLSNTLLDPFAKRQQWLELSS